MDKEDAKLVECAAVLESAAHRRHSQKAKAPVRAAMERDFTAAWEIVYHEAYTREQEAQTITAAAMADIRRQAIEDRHAADEED
jgi:hypothetical protein